MGVKGLWTVLRPSSIIEPVESLYLRDGFDRQGGGRAYRLGIDASIWFYQVQQTFAIGHAQTGENPELRTMFYRLARLLKMPVRPIFVFDGPGRPANKRGKKVVPTGHWMVQGMKQFIDAFGFHWRIAPGEAEAELALMNSIGIVDGVLTDDVDALLFGARTVIRNYTAKGENQVAILHSSVIQSRQSLTRGGMILIALLCGCDYDQTGVPGFGPKVSYGLARTGLGESLYEAAIRFNDIGLSQFLPQWREELRATLLGNGTTRLGRRYPALAKALPDCFPNLSVLRAYLAPLTSPLDMGIVRFQPRRLDVARLGSLCELYFTWGTEIGIARQFRSSLWPGIVTQALLAEAVHFDSHGDEAHNNPLLSLIGIHFPLRQPTKGTHRKVYATDTGFTALALSQLRGLRMSGDAEYDSALLPVPDIVKETPFGISIPAGILRASRHVSYSTTIGTTSTDLGSHHCLQEMRLTAVTTDLIGEYKERVVIDLTEVAG